MSMLQKSDIVELRIEHVVPVLDHCTLPWRDRAASVDEVNRQATSLTTVANRIERKSSFPNGVVITVVGSMEDEAQLLTSLDGQFLSKGFLRNTFRNASVTRIAPMPMTKSQSKNLENDNATGATQMLKRFLLLAARKAKNFLGSQSKHRSLV